MSPQKKQRKARPKKRKMYIGLDLGTLNSYILTKLSKVSSNESEGLLVPTVVGYPEEGILAGILPGSSRMLHGDEALANELHLRLVKPFKRRCYSRCRSNQFFSLLPSG